MSNTRKRRGAMTQALFAAYLRENGWPHATDAGAGRSGEDIINVPEAAIEVKARRGLDLPGWLRQAQRNAAGKLPVLVVRGDGQGPASIDEWAFVVPARYGVLLLKALRVIGHVHTALVDRDDPNNVRTYVSDHLAELLPKDEEVRP